MPEKADSEEPAWRLSKLFDAAEILHHNFHEDELDGEEVEVRARKAEEFVDKLSKLL